MEAMKIQALKKKKNDTNFGDQEIGGITDRKRKCEHRIRLAVDEIMSSVFHTKVRSYSEKLLIKMSLLGA